MNSGDVRSHFQSARIAVRAAFVMRAAVLLTLLAAPTDVAASCIAMTTCRAFEISSVVVQGTVTDMTDVDLGTDMVGGRAYPRTKTLVTIDVEKAWKGATPGTPVQVYTDGRRTSVGFEFVRGQRYVVFAGEWGGLLQALSCQFTNPIEKAGAHLTFLDTLSLPASGARVYGHVMFEQRGVGTGSAAGAGDTGDTGDWGRITLQAVSGRRISLKGPSGARDVVTNEDGSYQFEGLQPGAYELDADLPDGWDRRGLPRALTLEGLRSCEEVNISTAIDGRLSGQIVGTNGRPSVDGSADHRD